MTNPTKNTSSKRGVLLDRLGICVSALCLVQCLLLSLALIMAPLASFGFFSSDWFHAALLVVIVPFGLAAFWQGYQRHGRSGLMLTGVGGIALLLIAAVLEITLLPALAASAITALGGVLLITAHSFNLRASRRLCTQSEKSPIRSIGIAADC